MLGVALLLLLLSLLLLLFVITYYYYYTWYQGFQGYGVYLSPIHIIQIKTGGASNGHFPRSTNVNKLPF